VKHPATATRFALALLLAFSARGLAQQVSTASDTPDTRRRVHAVEYSDAYNTRLTIHRLGSYTVLPLVGVEYYLGDRLLNGTNSPRMGEEEHARRRCQCDRCALHRQHGDRRMEPVGLAARSGWPNPPLLTLMVPSYSTSSPERISATSCSMQAANTSEWLDSVKTWVHKVIAHDLRISLLPKAFG